METFEIETLAREAKDDRRKMNALIKELYPLAETVTSYYVRHTKGGDAHRDDIFNSALFGITKAVEAFDFGRTGFMAYCKRAMEIEVRDYLTQSVRMVRLPKHVVSNLSKLRKAEEHFQNLNIIPTRNQLRVEAGIDSEKTFSNVLEARKLDDTYSLDYSYDEEDDGYSLSSTVASCEDTEGSMFSQTLEKEVETDVRTLPEKERYAIIHTYGLYGAEKYSNARMSQELGVTVASVINYRNRGLSSLRSSLMGWAC